MNRRQLLLALRLPAGAQTPAHVRNRLQGKQAKNHGRSPGKHGSAEAAAGLQTGAGWNWPPDVDLAEVCDDTKTPACLFCEDFNMVALGCAPAGFVSELTR
jgi:hypothetical protein